MDSEFYKLRNALLEQYHFENEANPGKQSFNFDVLKNGFTHLCFVAQCIGSKKMKLSMKSACCKLANGIVPRPIIPFAEWLKITGQSKVTQS